MKKILAVLVVLCFSPTDTPADPPNTTANYQKVLLKGEDGGAYYPAGREVQSAGYHVCAGTAANDGGTAFVSLPTGDYIFKCSSDGCLNLSTSSGAGMITVCSGSSITLPAGFYAPLEWMETTIKATTPTADAGASDAAVYYAASWAGTMCCDFMPVR